MTRTYTHWDADYTPRDMGEPDTASVCQVCGWPRNQFNHTPVNCAKRRKDDLEEKKDEITNDI